MTPGKGSKYREFYDLSGRITCMPRPHSPPVGGRKKYLHKLVTWLVAVPVPVPAVLQAAGLSCIVVVGGSYWPLG